MGSISNEFPISLRSWLADEHDPTELPTLIQRINAERGGFLKLTEESLAKEIEIEELGEQNDDGSSSSEEETEDEPEKMKKLLEARDELMKDVHNAHQNALMALDFISLFLSKDLPTQAATTISPALKEIAGLQTLSADKLAAPKLTGAQKADNINVAKGWKAQSLNKAIDAILAAANRLEEEIDHETKYWRQVLAVSENGWAVCRLPNEKHILGVRYGFMEASPAFKNRSLAALRRNADGSISLDQGVGEFDPKMLRVRVQVNGVNTGVSTIPQLVPEDGAIEKLILQARNTIFAEELWQELNREARILPGIKDVDDSLVCDILQDKTIILDLVSLDEPHLPTTNVDFAIAEGVYFALNLLLSYSHRLNIHRRTQPKKPISQQKESEHPVMLMRGILTRISHQNGITSLQRLLKPLCALLNSTSVPASYTMTPNIMTPPSKLSIAERTITALINHLEAKVTLILTPYTTISITLNTMVNPVANLYHLALPNPADPLHLTCPPYTPLHSFSALQEYIFHATACALAATLVPSLLHTASLRVPAPKSDTENPKTEATNDQSLKDIPDVETQPTQKQENTDKWQLTPHYTSLISTSTSTSPPTTSPKTEKQRRLSITLHALPASPFPTTKEDRNGVELRLTWDHLRPDRVGKEGKEGGKGGKSGKSGEGAYAWVTWGSEGGGNEVEWDEGEGEVVRSFEGVVRGLER